MSGEFGSQVYKALQVDHCPSTLMCCLCDTPFILINNLIGKSFLGTFTNLSAKLPRANGSLISYGRVTDFLSQCCFMTAS